MHSTRHIKSEVVNCHKSALITGMHFRFIKLCQSFARFTMCKKNYVIIHMYLRYFWTNKDEMIWDEMSIISNI